MTPGAANRAPTPEATAVGIAAKGFICSAALERMKNLSPASPILGMVKIDCRNYGQKYRFAAKTITQCTIKGHSIRAPEGRKNIRISESANVHE
jgi:hypothetical protein